MKQKLLIITSLFVSSFSFTAIAQQATVASGNNAIGSGGSSSYTVGQIVYTTNVGSNGSVSQGVQQPFEISTLGIDEYPNINLTAYPNPTSDMLTLSVENHDADNLHYQLFDISGKLIKTDKLVGNQTQINMSSNASGAYFLNITEESKKIKTFKIIRK